MSTSTLPVLCLLLVFACVRIQANFNITFRESQVNETISGMVNVNVQNVYRFSIPKPHKNNFTLQTHMTKNSPMTIASTCQPVRAFRWYNSCVQMFIQDSYIRVEFIASLNSTDNCPIYFVVRQRKQVQIIDLPQKHEKANLTLYSGARTLCQDPEEWVPTIFITVSTCKSDSVTYSFKLTVMQEGYIIKLNELKTATDVSSKAPIFYRFRFPDNVDFVKLVANSSSVTRTTISIQEPKCPVYDELTTIKHTGHWHRMTNKTTLIVRKKMYPRGFIAVFLPEPCTQNSTAWQCLQQSADTVLVETISFRLEGPPDFDTIVVPSLWVPMVLYGLLILTVFTLFSYCHHQYVGGAHTHCTPACIHGLCPVNICRTKLRVESFTAETKLYNYLKANSYRYFWTTLTIVFFYGLPVVLLSLTLNQFVRKSGDLDTCHFNFSCSYPWWIFMSFNHVYSCLGFVLLGATFMVLVHLRATKLEVTEVQGRAISGEAQDAAGPWRWGRFRRVYLTGTVYGAYQNFGTFYTLGFALAFVGIMKMAYCTCPNRDTTFFGLTFMFIIVLLSQIKVYNLRHPCMVTDNFTFISIALIITAVTAGYLITNSTFRVLISVFISCWIQVTELILHSAGYVETGIEGSQPNTRSSSPDIQLAEPKPDTRIRQTARLPLVEPAKALITTPTGLFHSVLVQCNLRPLFYPEWKRRLVWVVLRFLLNVGTLTFIWMCMTTNHYSTRMYVLVLMNFLLDFTVYFVVHKGFHQEYTKYISWQPVIYLLLAIIFWAGALSALILSVAAWDLPSIYLQRTFTPCSLGIFDVLDMYHWLVAPAWFFTFMVMLTADDQLSRNRTEMTVVF